MGAPKDSSQLLADRIEAHLGGDVERIETHGAIVLLFGNRALKLKRPVHFSFMDFSTQAARRRAFAHELELNARTAPDIYRRLVPIAEDGQIDDVGEGEAVEWALEMARFDNSGRLDRVIERGEADRALFEALAARIADFHDSLPALAQPRQVDAMAEVVRGNAEDLRASVGPIFAPEAVEALIARTEEEFEHLRPLLAERQSWVRHCHGDLHSENIVLIDGQPVLFDCIEFNDAFAQIDTLYDIAFLVMDLCERGHGSLAWIVLQAYLDALPQDNGLALLPLFLSIRAAIRAKVEAFAGHNDKAQHYLAFASQALAPASPRLIAIGGLSGTGKTTLARAIAPAIAPAPGPLHLRSDLERKRMAGVSPTDRLPKEAYTQQASERVFRALNDRARIALAGGRSVIVDGVFARPEQRQAIEAVANAAGVPFLGIWLELQLAHRAERVEGRRGDASDADQRVVELQENYEIGDMAWSKIDSAEPLDDMVAAVLAALVG